MKIKKCVLNCCCGGCKAIFEILSLFNVPVVIILPYIIMRFGKVFKNLYFNTCMARGAKFGKGLGTGRNRWRDLQQDNINGGEEGSPSKSDSFKENITN